MDVLMVGCSDEGRRVGLMHWLMQLVMDVVDGLEVYNVPVT